MKYATTEVHCPRCGAAVEAHVVVSLVDVERKHLRVVFDESLPSHLCDGAHQPVLPVISRDGKR